MQIEVVGRKIDLSNLQTLSQVCAPITPVVLPRYPAADSLQIGEPWHVVRLSGEAVGFVRIKRQTTTDGGRLCNFDLWVHPDFHSLTAAILEELERYIKRQHKRRKSVLTLCTTAQQHTAQAKALRDQGFTEVGLQRDLQRSNLRNIGDPAPWPSSYRGRSSPPNRTEAAAQMWKLSGSPLTLQDFTRLITDWSLCFVAYCGADMVGYMVCSGDKARGVAFVNELVVPKPHGQSGVQATLTDHALATLRHYGYTQVGVTITSDDHTAAQFWRDRSFLDVGRYTDYRKVV